MAPRTRKFRDTAETTVEPADTERYAAVSRVGTEQPQPVDQASEKQRNFILSLLDEKDLRAGGKVEADTDDQYRAAIELIKAQVPTLSKKVASGWIESLLKFPKLAGTNLSAKVTTQVPNGHYCVDGTTIGDGGDSGLRFYKVNTPTQGKWAGFTFVDAQGGPTYYPIKNRAHKEQILKAIAKDPREAAIRYGKELGVCGICNTELTNEESRSYGIGPICRKKTGW